MRGLLLIFIAFCFFPGIAAAEIARSAKMPSFYVPNGALRAIAPDKNITPKAPISRKSGTVSTPKTNNIVPETPTTQNTGTVPLPERYDAVIKPTVQLKPAPIDKILQKNALNCDFLDFPLPLFDKDYKSSIVASFSLKREDLNKLLQYEYQKINDETRYMINIKNNIPNTSSAYRFANYKLSEQISQDIAQRNKQYKNLKKILDKILKKMPHFKIVYLIDSKRPDFLVCQNKTKTTRFTVLDIITYISIFDNNFNHLLTYKHINDTSLKRSRIYAPEQTSSKTNIVNFYQQLLDDYVADLIRIGRGLDVNNPMLLRQLGKMQNQTHVLELQ